MSDSIDENMIDQLLESINENNNINLFTKNLENELLKKDNNIDNNINNNINNNNIKNNNIHKKLIKIFNNNRDIIINSLIFFIINLIFINKTDNIYIIIKTIILISILYIKKNYI